MARVRDLGYAVRHLCREPIFTCVSIAMLAIGIGATVIAFTLVNALYWKSLPVHAVDELAVLTWTSPTLQNPSTLFPHRIYRALTANGLTAACSWRGRSALAEWGPITYALVTGSYFRTLGVPALHGRMLDVDDDRPGAPPVAVVSARLSRRVFGVDASAIGQTLRINDVVFTVVGVMAEGFGGLDPSQPREVMVPFTAAAVLGLDGPGGAAPGCRELVVRVRTPEAEVRLRALGQSLLTDALQQQNAPRSRDARLVVEPLTGSAGLFTLRQQARIPLSVLTAMAGLILIGTCANLGTLLSARASGRHREIAVRLALGAGRARVLRQLFVENVLLAIIAAPLAYLIAAWAARWLPDLLGELTARNWLDATVTPALDLEPDLRVFAFALAAALAASLVFGIAPALRAMRIDLISVTGRQSVSARALPSLGSGRLFLGLQIAMSVTLLIATGLLLMTVGNLARVPVGYDSRGLTFVTIGASTHGSTLVEEAIARLRALPDVRSVALSEWPIYNNAEPKLPVCVPGAGEMGMDIEPITPGFFATWGVVMIAGRDFTSADRTAASLAPGTLFDDGFTAGRAAQVVIVNESFAKRFFAGANPIGRRVGIGRCPAAGAEIIGIVADHLDRQRMTVLPMVYVPYPEIGVSRFATFAVRSGGDARALIGPIRRIMASLNAPVDGDVMTGAAYQDRELRRDRMLSRALVAFASFALLVTCLGVYGAIDYSVRARTAEVGLRVALGSPRTRAALAAIRGMLAPVVTGIVLGVVIAGVAARRAAVLLFGISPFDPVISVAAVLVLLVIAAGAAFVPARRAVSLAPSEALRAE